MQYETCQLGASSTSGADLIVVPDLQELLSQFKNDFPSMGPVKAAKAIRETAKNFFNLAYVIATINPKGFNSYLARNFERTSRILTAMSKAFTEVFSEAERMKASSIIKEINVKLEKAKPHVERAIKKNPKTGDQYAAQLYMQGKLTRKEVSRKMQLPVDDVPQRTSESDTPETETVPVEVGDQKIPTAAIAAGLGLAAFLSLR